MLVLIKEIGQICTSVLHRELLSCICDRPGIHLRAPNIHMCTPNIHLCAPAIDLRAPAIHLHAPAIHLNAPAVHLREPAASVRNQQVLAMLLSATMVHVTKFALRYAQSGAKLT